jgi:hypothetical protein
MRKELRRQIAKLERDIAQMKAVVGPWEMARVTPRRGPALLGAEPLEQVRDELLAARHRLAQRFKTADR